ncbi:hypothetical protein B1987_21180 [Mycobacterium kansasii]|nr:hypothetical protein B1987_21180 [Mycobacterium kansasii]
MVCRCFDVSLTQFELVIESRSATPKPAGQPGNDTDVIRHALGSWVKHSGAFPYHLVIKFRRFCFGSGYGVSRALRHNARRGPTPSAATPPGSAGAGEYCPAM